VTKLVFVNGDGGNYVLSNVVQESNVGGRRMALFPRAEDCNRAKARGPSYRDADFSADDRRHLLTVGVRVYPASGIIG
jgi:creatinine amidohydrolase